MKIWLIVDVSNIVFRGAYGNPSLTTSKGKPSGHVFGSVSSLLSVLRNELNGYEVEMVFCYDGIDSKKYRTSILPEYKASREAREFNPIPEAKEVLRLWPGLQIEEASKEGDDAIAYSVKMLKGKDCVVFTGDKDLWQLLQYPNCRVLSPNLKRFVEPADIYGPYHLQNFPEKIPLAKSLFGDASDNIKGVERLIKKQVEPILNSEGVLTPEDFYNALNRVGPGGFTGKTWQKLIDAKEKVFKNYLVVLPQLDFDKASTTKVGKESFSLLKEALISYECFSLLNSF